ncbi:DUF3073 domain-containing protein [Actinotignum sp. GS-2025f]|uniref:DUF3073 domain-containing protein n=1 Tax=Actinotignum schaalii FB123-CNA-2 TaxID=883067 RepID=S2VJC1_9ACTO|nr:hypothetical protein HMPREF9237_00557 [Actinotignum schaalii FB123-CNA-2]
MKGVELMGRGRQKAKQRKVARNLKYFTPDTDYAALERELGINRDARQESHYDSSDDPYARYADYADYDESDDNDDDWADDYDPNNIPPATK